jgi:hypothetical protein
LPTVVAPILPPRHLQVVTVLAIAYFPAILVTRVLMPVHFAIMGIPSHLFVADLQSTG